MPLLIACHARGPHFQQIHFHNDVNSLIYIYRPFTTFQHGSADIPVLYIDEKKVDRLPIGGYCWTKVKPGKHKLQLKKTIFFGLAEAGSVAAMDIDTETAGVYYVRYSHDFKGFTVDGHARSSHGFVLLPWEQAQPEITRVHFTDGKSFID